MTEQELHRLPWTNIKTLITICKLDPNYFCTLKQPHSKNFSLLRKQIFHFYWKITMSVQLAILIHSFFFFLRLFTYFWLCWVFVAACGLSPVGASQGYSSLRCLGFSLWWLLGHGAQALGKQASIAAALRLGSCSSGALECWLRSCGRLSCSLACEIFLGQG